MTVNGIEREILRLIYSYLKGRKQYVKINNTYSDNNDIISGVPQGSILGTILFNVLINDLFFSFRGRLLSAWGETVSKLINTLESESNIAND